MATTTVTVLYGKILRELTLRAQRGGEATAELVLKRARAKAPVRKIFRGTTYKVGKSGFRQPTLRQVSTGAGRGEDETVKGQPNSFQPLLRVRKTGGKTQYLTGDLRAVSSPYDPLTPEQNKSRSINRLFEKQKGGPTTVRDTAAINILSLRVPTRSGKTRSALTTRGRYEVRSGRANFKGADGVTRVGGRLRESIHIEGPIREGGTMWWYIVADAKDPQTGRLYGRDQEYGTRHHPPHPFLRPALQESRGALVKNVRRALARGTP